MMDAPARWAIKGCDMVESSSLERETEVSPVKTSMMGECNSCGRGAPIGEKRICAAWIGERMWLTTK